MRISSLPILLTAVFALSGCAGMTDTQQRTLSGAGIGAAGGAAIGAFSGNAGKGALIGTAVGAAGGYLYDQNKKSR
jgi:hypothetical protein